MIHKSATEAFQIAFTNGNTVVLHLGHNRNTGGAIVWQVVWKGGKPGPSNRLTGGNIAKLAAEIRNVPATEGAVTIHSQAAYDMIMQGCA